MEIIDNLIVNSDINTEHAQVYYVPQVFALHPAFPNPFNPITHINFDIPYSGHIELSIYDINGRKVDVLYDTNIDAGYHQLIWNANQFSSGVYFAVLSAGNYRSTQKIILLK